MATKTSRVRLCDLTAETIRVQTKAGDTPLHRAAKNGQFADVPAHLLTADLFMVQNERQETPLHYAAKHGTLNQVPPQFLTRETMLVADYYGRTPLHVAADYRQVAQIPKEFLTPEYLGIQTKNFRSETVLHLAAGTNTLDLIPSKCITPELLQIRNGYGYTPSESLQAHLPTEGQKLRLDAIGCTENRLTKERASAIIEDHETKHQVYALKKKEKDAPAPPIKLEYIKREPSPEPSGDSWRVTILAKSSSGDTPYKVEFVVHGSDLLARCHCQGGRTSLCKHLLGMIKGDVRILHDPNQIPHFKDLQALPQFKSLKPRIAEFQNKVQDFQNRLFAEDSKFNNWYEAYRETRSPSERQVIGEGMIHFEIVTNTADYMDAPDVQAKLKETKERKALITEEKRRHREEFIRCLRSGFN